jgi:phage N-6-adenine-methyltransferase
VFAEFHHRFWFTVDAAASNHNAMLPRYWTREIDGLSMPWKYERVWCNPPYSNIRPWVEKASKCEADIAVMLLPANRTEQGWWQDLIEPGRRDGSIRVEFLRGRMRFIAALDTKIRPNQRPPFGVCLVIFERRSQP